jgi:hypothetical protein
LINEVLPGCNPDCKNFFAVKEDIYGTLISRLMTEIGSENPLIPYFKGVPFQL